MATISISATNANEMNPLMIEFGNSVDMMHAEFLAMEYFADSANTDIYDMSAIITTAKDAKEVQSDKLSAICTLSEDIDEFIRLAVNKDIDLQDEINDMKDDFYKAYPDLRPESEKPWYEKVADWFAENWEIIAIIYVAIVVVALVIIATVVTGGTFAAALAGVLAVGAIAGLANTIGTFIGDLLDDGKINGDWREYVGSFVGGFISGVFKIICPVPFLGDFVGGFYGSIFTTALTNLTNGDGEDTSFAMGLAKAYGDGFINGALGCLTDFLFVDPLKSGLKVDFIDEKGLASNLTWENAFDFFGGQYVGTFFNSHLNTAICGPLDALTGDNFAPNIGIYGVSVAIGGPFAIPLAIAWGNAAFSDSGVVQSIVAPSLDLQPSSMPEVTVADITIPNITMPDFSVPSIVMPNISAPTITVPNIAVPAISIAMPVFG